MSPQPRNNSTPLRLWPGAAGAMAVILGLFVVPVVLPDQFMYGMFGSIAAGLVIAIWWVFFSRAPWAERLSAIVVAILVLPAMKRIVDPSIAGAGMNMMLPMFGITVVGLGLAAGVVIGSRLGAWPRRAAIVTGILLGWSTFAVIRTGGISG